MPRQKDKLRKIKSMPATTICGSTEATTGARVVGEIGNDGSKETTTGSRVVGEVGNDGDQEQPLGKREDAVCVEAMASIDLINMIRDEIVHFITGCNFKRDMAYEMLLLSQKTPTVNSTLHKVLLDQANYVKRDELQGMVSKMISGSAVQMALQKCGNQFDEKLQQLQEKMEQQTKRQTEQLQEKMEQQTKRQTEQLQAFSRQLEGLNERMDRLEQLFHVTKKQSLQEELQVVLNELNLLMPGQEGYQAKLPPMAKSSSTNSTIRSIGAAKPLAMSKHILKSTVITKKSAQNLHNSSSSLLSSGGLEEPNPIVSRKEEMYKKLISEFEGKPATDLPSNAQPNANTQNEHPSNNFDLETSAGQTVFTDAETQNKEEYDRRAAEQRLFKTNMLMYKKSPYTINLNRHKDQYVLALGKEPKLSSQSSEMHSSSMVRKSETTNTTRPHHRCGKDIKHGDDSDWLYEQ